MVEISIHTFKTHIDNWKNLLFSLNHQESGVESNMRDVNLFIRFCDEQKYTAISGEIILAFIAWLKDERANSSAAINRKISSLKSYLRHLRFLSIDGSDTIPIKELPRCRQPYPGPIQALEPEEVQKIIRSIDISSVIGYRDYVLYSMIYHLGLRISEAIGLSLADINFDKEIITIHGKGGKKRELPLVSQLITILQKWLVLRENMLNATNQEAVFVSKKGNRLAIRTAQDNFKKYVEKVGELSLSKVTPHSLRQYVECYNMLSV